MHLVDFPAEPAAAGVDFAAAWAADVEYSVALKLAAEPPFPRSCSHPAVADAGSSTAATVAAAEVGLVVVAAAAAAAVPCCSGSWAGLPCLPDGLLADDIHSWLFR